MVVVCIDMKVQCGSWPGHTQSMAVYSPHVAMIGKSFSGKNRSQAGPRSMSIQITTHQVKSLAVTLCMSVNCYSISVVKLLLSTEKICRISLQY